MTSFQKPETVLTEICLEKEMQHIILYTNVHACSPSYTDKELNTFQPIPKQSVLGLVMIVL